MGRIKHSIAWWSFTRGTLTPEQLVRAAAEIGYDGVELPEQEHWPLIKEHGLTIGGIL